MGIFKDHKLRKRLKSVEEGILDSFSRVKEDIDSANAWIRFYYDKSNNLERSHQQLLAQTDFMRGKIEEHNAFHDDHKRNLQGLKNQFEAFSHTLQRLQYELSNRRDPDLTPYIDKISDELKRIDAKIEELSYLPTRLDTLKERFEHHAATVSHTAVERKVEALQEKLNSLIIKKTPKQKWVQKVTKQSHDYLKAMILSYIKKYGRISAFQLREMVVEEQNLTSKSTFYRIMEEIEALEDISVIKEGKQKIYFSSLKKPQQNQDI